MDIPNSDWKPKKLRKKALYVESDSDSEQEVKSPPKKYPQNSSGIPTAPELVDYPQPERKSCKIILMSSEGKINSYCLVGSDLLPGPQKNLYAIPDTNILIDQISFQLLNHPKINAFVLVKKRDNLYALQPLRDKDLDKYNQKKKLSSDSTYVENNDSKSGTYGKVDLYPTEKVVSKMSKKSDAISFDMVREIAAYRLLKEISCLPNFYGFEINNEEKDVGVKLNIELGRVLTDVILNVKTDLTDVKLLMFRSVKCLRAFASQGIIHCDLKPDNMVVSADGSVQFIDWGMAEIDHSKNQTRLKSYAKQTPTWAAPEVLLAESKLIQFSYKIDVFSLGLIFIALFTRKKHALPFESVNSISKIMLNVLLNLPTFEMSSAQIKDEVSSLMQNEISIAPIIKENLLTKNFFLRYNTRMEEDMADLISHMLEFNPNLRWTYDQIILHPLFRSIYRESIPKMPVYINNMPIVDNIQKHWDQTSFSIYRKKFIKIMILNDLKPVEVNISLNPLFKKPYSYITSYETLCLTWQIADLVAMYKPSLFTKENINECFQSFVLLARRIYEPNPNISKYKPSNKLETEILYLLQGNLIRPSVYSYYAHYNGEVPAGDPKMAAVLEELYTRDDIYSRPLSEVAKKIEL